MKKLAGILLIGSIVPMAHANEFAPIVAKSEIVQDMPVSRQVCHNEQVTTEPEHSAAGAVIGGVAGGLLGHTVGKGGGKTAATAIGAITGAIVGDRVDNRDAEPGTRVVQRCGTVTEHQDQVVGYRVTYEFGGKRYTTRMANDPGDRVELHISVVGGDDAPPVSYRDDRNDRRGRYRD